MHNKYARQSEKLRAWQSASGVEREKKPDGYYCVTDSMKCLTPALDSPSAKYE